MIVHRFMSDAEYEVLVAGGRLMNATDHARKYGRRTDCIGFCFFIEEPEKAIHWLSGCCYPDHCVTLDIPDRMLREGYGIYRDPERDDLTRGPIMGGHLPTMQKREYCLTSYALSDGITIISDTEEYRYYANIRREMEANGLI